jgi:DNA-binding MarR family transcriptional regulator
MDNLRVSAKQDSIDRMVASWEPEIPGVDPEIEAAVQRINWIFRRIRRRMGETLADHDLTYEEWSLLGHLKRPGPPYSSTPGKLAELQGLSSGAMTNRLDRLEEAGLIRRRPDLDDRRSLQVELTDKGHRAWLETVHAQAAKEAAIGAALNERELAQLNTLLRKVVSGFEDGS